MGVANERMLADLDNDSIHRILHMRCRDRVQTVGLRLHLRLTSLSAQFAQRRLRWFGHAARRPEGDLFRNPLLLTPPRLWRKGAGGQLKTRASLRLRTMKKEMSESTQARRDVALFKTRSIPLAVLVQPAPAECCHNKLIEAVLPGPETVL